MLIEGPVLETPHSTAFAKAKLRLKEPFRVLLSALRGIMFAIVLKHLGHSEQ